MPSIAPVISPAATPWTAGGSTGSTDVFRAPATAAARRWAPVTGSGEGLSNREKGTPRHGRAHAMHLCASVWPRLAPYPIRHRHTHRPARPRTPQAHGPVHPGPPHARGALSS